MKVEILRLIEDALVGGRNGEMAFIENNPFIRQLFHESGKPFEDFLLDCIGGVKEKENEIKTTEYITKKIRVQKSSEEYYMYAKMVKEEEEARRKRVKAFDDLVEKIHPLLKEVSTYEIVNDQYDTYIEFKILSNIIKELK